jgi:type I restriction enzyme, S subunit
MEVLQDTYKDTKIGRIPKDWDLMMLNEITNYKSSNLSLNKLEENTGKYKLYGASGMLKGIDFYQTDKESFAIVKDGSGFGNLLWCDKNSSILGTLGRITNKEISDLKFCFYLTHTIKFKRYMSGSTIPHLYYTDYGNIKLPVPPLPEQRKIAAILSTVDELISTTDKIIEKSKELKKGLMQKLFSEGIGHTEFKDTKIGRIPKDWEVVRLKKLLSKPTEYGANSSAIDFNEHTYRYVRITDIHSDGRLNKTGIAGILREEGKKYLLNQDDVIIARTGNTVGKSYLYNITDGDCAYAGYLIRFVVNKDVLLPQYLFQYLQSNFFWNWVKRTVRTGAQPNINSKEYQSMRIPLPRLSDQNKIATILLEADAKIEKEQTQKAQLEALKKGLMQQLLTGKKRVKV